MLVAAVLSLHSCVAWIAMQLASSMCICCSNEPTSRTRFYWQWSLHVHTVMLQARALDCNHTCMYKSQTRTQPEAHDNMHQIIIFSLSWHKSIYTLLCCAASKLCL